ncbi:acidic repeat-containing protein [Echinops telfairi]|uniref:Acidic repeat-containing protein n=1 Tax=Echinops telfairi TaxID=9371 RepID=A0ABM0ZTR3_ECHTE|nr:acidic repeat-containing protein [Echinops telfairi]
MKSQSRSPASPGASHWALRLRRRSAPRRARRVLGSEGAVKEPRECLRARGDTEMSQEEANISGSQYDECCSLSPGSSKSDEFEAFVARRRMKKKRLRSGMVITSESEDEDYHEDKKTKLCETSSNDEAEQLPFFPDDDDGSDLSDPMLEEGSLCDTDQMSSNDQELGECAISQHNVSDDLGEQNLGESFCQLLNTAEPKPESIDEKLPTEEEPAPVVEKPRKRTAKTKHIEVPPVPTGRQNRVPSKKISSSAKVEKYQTGSSVCKIPGCFLLDLEKSKQYSGKKFKKNKDELVQKIYNLFNSSVFDKKLPKKIDIAWNKKMLKTAGICTTGEIKHPKKQRYAKIEIAQKVCDSADRLRDTLVHEICHVASWLLDGTRDSHGDAWKYYAHKSTMIHPELPKITCYHSYTINYRIHYECIQCKTRIGRYTRSLNTDRCICAHCRGPLVLLPLTRKDGTPIEPYVRPFAKYVQENYRLVKQELGGKGHGDVMKKLSKDYIASKQKQGC